MKSRIARRSIPSLEALETREMLAGSITASLGGSVLRVEGTSAADRIEIRSELQSAAHGGQAVTTVYGNGKQVFSSASRVDSVRIDSLGGNDTILQMTGKTSIIDAGAGNDTVQGGSGSDTIYGGVDNDFLYGNGGTDYLYGQDGNDWLEAGSSSEFANGGSGLDWNAYRWVVGGVRATDIDQGASNRCVLLASLAGAARLGIDLGGRISYLGNHMYRVRMFDQDKVTVTTEKSGPFGVPVPVVKVGDWVNINVKFDGTPVRKSDGSIVDPSSKGDDSGAADGKGFCEFWTVLYQRAYVQHFMGIDPLNGDAAEYQARVGDHGPTLAAVTGWKTESPSAWDVQVTTTSGPFGIRIPKIEQSAAVLARRLKAAIDHGDLVTVGGTGHAYNVVNVWQDSKGVWKVKLYNPWGHDGAHNSFAFEDDGNDDDGYMTLTVESLRTHFAHYFHAIKP